MELAGAKFTFLSGFVRHALTPRLAERIEEASRSRAFRSSSRRADDDRAPTGGLGPLDSIDAQGGETFAWATQWRVRPR